MDAAIQKLQTFVKNLQERFENLPTATKFAAGLMLFMLLPCVAVCRTKWKSWVKAIVCFFLLSFMLGVLMIAFVFYLLWFIWKKTGWKTYVKGIITILLIGIPLLLGLLFGEKAPPSAVSPPPSIYTEPPATPSNDVPQTTHLPPEESVPPITPSPAEEDETPYLLLAKDTDAYLLFLRIIGTCYKDNSLTQEMFDEMAQYSGVQALVEDVLNYNYQQGALSPDFANSFSAFWTNDIASAHPEVTEALQVSFDLDYKLIEKVWAIKENDATIATHTQNTIYTVDGIDYYDFDGRIEKGSIIYIKDGIFQIIQDGDSMIPYMEVLDFGVNKRVADGSIISNAIYIRDLYSIFGGLDIGTRWRDLDDMLRHSRETRESQGVPVFFVKANH